MLGPDNTVARNRQKGDELLLPCIEVAYIGHILLKGKYVGDLDGMQTLSYDCMDVGL